MAAEGHERQFQAPELSARYRFGQETFAEAAGNDEVAPRADSAASVYKASRRSFASFKSAVSKPSVKRS